MGGAWYDLLHTYVQFPAASPLGGVALYPELNFQRLGVDTHLFPSFRSTSQGDASQQEFTLDRAELGVRPVAEFLRGELRLEAVRSAGRESLLGVDGNALVMKVKRASVGARVPMGAVTVEGDFGLIFEPWIWAAQQVYDMRGFDPLLAESAGFFAPSDVGASVRVSALNRVALTVALTNGEGNRQLELNDGKNTSVVLEGSTPTFPGLRGPLALFAAVGYRDGSEGPSKIKSHRSTATFALRGADGNLGAEFVSAQGYNQRTDAEASGWRAWAALPVYPKWIGLIADYAQVSPDADLDGTQQVWTAGLYTDLTQPLPDERFRVYLTYQDRSFDADVAPDPGNPEASNVQVVMLRVSLMGRYVFEDTAPTKRSTPTSQTGQH